MAGPDQQGLTARMTRQRTREQSSKEGINGTSTNGEDAIVVSAHAQVDVEDQMGNEGKKSLLLSLIHMVYTFSLN
jgi:hypothetical protein